MIIQGVSNINYIIIDIDDIWYIYHRYIILKEIKMCIYYQGIQLVALFMRPITGTPVAAIL